MARKRAEEYYLMHKDIPVCLMELSGDGTLGELTLNRDQLIDLMERRMRIPKLEKLIVTI